MRISKVKVQDNNRKDVMVLMHRTTGNGALVYEGETNVRTSEILPKKKLDSFGLSIENKTLIKRDSLKDKKQKDNYDIVKKIITKRELPIQLLVEDVLPFLNHKFQNEIIYYKNNEPYRFRLDSLIVEAVKEKNPQKLQPYDDWKNWYISTKSSHLIQSIEQNKIDLTGTDSKRKRTLQTWAATYTMKGSINIFCCHSLYKIDTLTEALNHTDKGELNEKGIPKNTNEFHRKLKKTLQNHQKMVFGTREEPNMENRNNDQLAIYHLEVVKYLEHYFSVKSTHRKNTKSDIDYYLSVDTIKKTIQKQLLNAVRNSLLQQGKAVHHEYNENTDSKQLTEIKRNEAFVLNMIDACAFAANNIRNIVDTEQTNDILVWKEYVKSLDTNRVNNQLFKFFFGTDLPATDKHKEKTLWAMRGAVQQIRNTIVHYKQGTLDTIFKVKEFEFPNNGEPSYTDTIYKTCLKTELQQVPEAFAQQLKTGGALAYYPYDDLKMLLNTVSFSLCRSVVPFAPGFKKVQKQGQNYQNAQNENFYDLVLKSYLPKGNDASKEDAYNARYFLLKLIYNHLFLRDFTENRAQFAETVDYILSHNKKQAEVSRSPKAYAFEAVRQMQKDESITDYMAYVQSQLRIEQNKKEENKPDNKRINFEKFVLQLFIKGFDTFLQDKKFAFIAIPWFQLADNSTNQQQADALNQLEQNIIRECHFRLPVIKTDDATHIAFFTFCKLLDANHLSNLRNELIKFKCSTKEFELHHVLEIIELCLLRADVVPAKYEDLYTDKQSCIKRILPFVAVDADISKWSDLFVQTDHQTPVVHANVELTVKYGTAKLLEQLIATNDAFKITEVNFTLWNNAREIIEVIINRRLVLHQQWEETVRKDEEEKHKRVKPKSNFAQKFIEDNGDDYFDLCDYIDAYNWQDNKLHFVHLSQLHNLTIEILGRMAGFVALFDRDFQLLDAGRTEDAFRLKAFVSLREIAKELKKTNDITKIKGIDDIITKEGFPISEVDRPDLITCIEEKRKYYNTVFFKSSANPFVDRNYIAHFKYLSTTAGKYSLIELLNTIRDLLSYDRKLKNAVNKAFIDIFDKHGMILKLKINAAHRFEVESVEPKLLYHLGTNERSDDPLSSYQVKPQYCAMCEALLEMKK